MRALSESNASVMVGVAILLSMALPLNATAQTASRQATFRWMPRVNDFLRPVVVTGEVNRPGTFPVIDSPTLAEVLEMAGGLTGNAGPTAVLVHFSDNAPLTPPSRGTLVRLVRASLAVPPNITLTRIAVVDGSGLDKRLALEPQDILFVPSKNES